jgi:hypothetical protein
MNYQTFQNPNTSNISSISSTSSTENYCINVCFRIARNDDGSNAAVNPNIIPQVLADLNAKFNPQGVSFKQDGNYSYIDNTKYNLYTSTPFEVPALTPNCFNIFFIKTFTNLDPAIAGIASFGTLRAVIRGNDALVKGIVAHEVGHGLNLVHTYKCTVKPLIDCTDNPSLNDGSCLTKGDYICDTPADYSPFDFNVNNPPPYPISAYNPDKNNIMSGWLDKTKFSNGQGVRLKDAISNAPQLQSIRSYECVTITGVNRFCTNPTQNYSYSLPNYGSGSTYNWSVIGNLQIVGSTTNSSVTVKRLSANGVNIGILKAVINGSIIKYKGIRTKCHWFAKPVGIYDWVSTNYDNMGVIIPIDLEDEHFVSYFWEITEENPNSIKIGDKPVFIGSHSVNPNKFSSNTNQATINWGSISQSYLITCNGVNEAGDHFLLSENIVDVGDSKNNPCFKNNFNQIIAPNPVINGNINIVIDKPEQSSPCNYKQLDENYFFNTELDRINNSVTVFDYNGNHIFSGVFDTNEFTIEGLNLISGNNYIVNLFTNEGGFKQSVIIAQ